MNRIEVLTKITGIKVNKVVAIKPHHISNRASIIFNDDSNEVFEATLADITQYVNSNTLVSENILNGMDIMAKDIKDAFRTNDVDMNVAEVVVNKASSYTNSFKQWGITVDDLKGHVNVDRAIVSDFYIIDNAELKYNDELLVINYKANNSDLTETVYYVNYSPIAHDDKAEAEKAAKARDFFGIENANEIINNHRFAKIVTKDELEKKNELQKLRYCQMGNSDLYVNINAINTVPTGDKIKAMIDKIITDKMNYDSKYVIGNGIHQGHLSEMRNGKRAVNRMTLSNVMTYLDAFKF